MGIITIDKQGEFGISHNSESMPVALINSKDEKIRLYLESINKIDEIYCFLTEFISGYKSKYLYVYNLNSLRTY